MKLLMQPIVTLVHTFSPHDLGSRESVNFDIKEVRTPNGNLLLLNTVAYEGAKKTEAVTVLEYHPLKK